MRKIARYTTCFPAALVLLLAGCEVTPVQQQDTPVYYPSQPAPPAYTYEDINRCRANNRQAHQDVVTRYENAKRAGRINPNETQQFNAMEARLRNYRANLANDGLTLQECQRIGGAIARERVIVDDMLR
jgi:hypothetical protein